MFEPVQKDGPFDRLVSVCVAAWSSLWLKRLTLGLLVLLIVGLGGWMWFWSATLDITCRTPEVRQFTVDEFLDLRDRKKAYQRSTAPVAWMSMRPDEATFLLAESKGLFVELAAAENRLSAHLGIPDEGGCYNVYFEGVVDVEDSILRIEPDVVYLGGFDLSWILGGRVYEYDSEDIVDPQISGILRNVRALKVEAGELRLRLKNKAMKWEF